MTEPSPCPRKFRRCKQERPGQLLAAALEVFGEKGFALTRLADVGRRAGVTPGTVCAYFPSKEALFIAVIRHYMLPEIEVQQAIITGAGTPRERLVRLLRAKYDVLGRPYMAALAKLMVAEIGNFPELAREFFTSTVEPSIEQFAQLLSEGMRSGCFRAVEPRLQARLLMQPIAFDAIWRVSLGHCESQPVDRQELFEAHLVTALRGLDLVPDAVPPPTPPSPAPTSQQGTIP